MLSSPSKALTALLLFQALTGSAYAAPALVDARDPAVATTSVKAATTSVKPTTSVKTTSVKAAVTPVKAAVTPVKAAATPSVKPGVLIIQPNNGGGAADDCGNGPISLNKDTWAAHNMDKLISDMFSQRSSDPNFDFHQDFGNKYGVDFYCPNSFDNCDTTPASCKDLTGTPAEKEQGWLGIKAMMNVQQMYIQWEKVISNSLDTLTSSTVDFQSVSFVPENVYRAPLIPIKSFAPPTAGAKLARKNAVTGVSGVLAIGAVLATLFVPGSTLLVIGGAAITGNTLAIGAGIGAGVTSWVGTAVNDAQDAAESDELDVLKISDLLPVFKNAALSGFEFSHNGTFSNGQVNGASTGTVST